MKALLKLALGALLGLTLVACASGPQIRAAADDQPFIDWYMQLADQIKHEPSYRRIPLDTREEADTFVGWLHDTYRRRMTQAQFADRVAASYPGHEQEIIFILSRLPDPAS